MPPSRPIHTSTTWILLIALLLIFNASIEFDEVPPSISWSQPSSAPAPLQFELLNRVALRINQSYMEPDRIDPEAMFLKAMHFLELEIPEFVLSNPQDEKRTTVVIMGSDQISVDTEKLTSIWQTVFHVSDILRMLHRSPAVSANMRARIEQIACQGMLSTLDAHSMVLSEAALFELKQNTLGRFGGIGVVIASRNQELRIIEVMPDTPAHKAGLKAGDHILEIDKDTTQNLSLQEAAELLRGPMGSSVSLMVEQNKNQRPKRVKLIRSKIDVSSVAKRELKDHIGYVQIDHFQEQTIVEVSQALQNWKAPIRGLILDLRNNPGGLLEQAISISDLFLSAGDIVTTVGYQKEPTQVHRATKDTLNAHTPIVVLVDEQSASASEILAAALQDNGRAVVFGRPTYGKGSVQVLFEFPNKWGLKITVAQYLTPNKASIQDVGLQPNVHLNGFSPGDVETYQSPESMMEKRINPAGIRLDYLKSQGKDHQDEELEIARQFLVSKAKTLDAKEAFKLKPAIQNLASTYSSALRRAFKTAGLSWFAPECNNDTKMPITVHLDTEPNISSSNTWSPKISITNTSSKTIGALRLSIRSGDRIQRVSIGGLSPAKTLTFEPDTPVKLVSQNEQCLVQLVVEDSCANTQARKDVVLKCASPPDARARSSLLLSDLNSGNGNGVLEFGERGELHLQLIGNNVPMEGEITASLALLGQPRERLVRLVNGKSMLNVEEPSSNQGHMVTLAPLVFKFELEAKRRARLARSSPQQLLLQVTNQNGEHLIYKTFNLTIYPSEPASKLSMLKPSQRRRSTVKVKAGAKLHFQPDMKSEVIAQTDGHLEVVNRRGDWLLISVDSGFGWLNQTDRQHTEVQQSRSPQQPKIKMRYTSGGRITFERRAVVTNHASFVLKGAFSGFDLKDYRFFHNGKKKVYARIQEKSVLGYPFETVIDLAPGMNRVDAILRSNSGYETSRTFFVTRKGNIR